MAKRKSDTQKAYMAEKANEINGRFIDAAMIVIDNQHTDLLITYKEVICSVDAGFTITLRDANNNVVFQCEFDKLNAFSFTMSDGNDTIKVVHGVSAMEAYAERKEKEWAAAIEQQREAAERRDRDARAFREAQNSVVRTSKRRVTSHIDKETGEVVDDTAEEKTKIEALLDKIGTGKEQLPSEMTALIPENTCATAKAFDNEINLVASCPAKGCWGALVTETEEEEQWRKASIYPSWGGYRCENCDGAVDESNVLWIVMRGDGSKASCPTCGGPIAVKSKTHKGYRCSSCDMKVDGDKIVWKDMFDTYKPKRLGVELHAKQQNDNVFDYQHAVKEGDKKP